MTIAVYFYHSTTRIGMKKVAAPYSARSASVGLILDAARAGT